jgi:NitT/TauT family transport system substrate-binding protein
MKKRLLRVFSVFVLAALLLSACSGTQVTVKKTPLRVGWSLWPGWYPLVLADQKGFFKEHGLEIEIVYYNTTSEVTAAMASGMVDGGFMVLNSVLLDTVIEDAKVILITDNSDGADQIVTTADILSADDIRGKRIGVKKGTFGEFFVREMLDQKGILPAEVTFVDVSPEAVPGSIPDKIDLGHTYEPFTSEARAKGYQVIFSSAETPGLIVDIFAFRNHVIQERPEDVKAFIAAWFEALQYWQANPAESNAIIAKATGQKAGDISTEGIKLFDLAANLQAFRAGNDANSIYFTARKAQYFSISAGDISHAHKAEDALDASFLK